VGLSGPQFQVGRFWGATSRQWAAGQRAAESGAPTLTPNTDKNGDRACVHPLATHDLQGLQRDLAGWPREHTRKGGREAFRFPPATGDTTLVYLTRHPRSSPSASSVANPVLKVHCMQQRVPWLQKQAAPVRRSNPVLTPPTCWLARALGLSLYGFSSRASLLHCFEHPLAPHLQASAPSPGRWLT
jgi:hypothetical protein